MMEKLISLIYKLILFNVAGVCYNEKIYTENQVISETRDLNITIKKVSCISCVDSTLIELNAMFYNQPMKFGYYEVDIDNLGYRHLINNLNGSPFIFKIHKNESIAVYLEGGGRRNMATIIDRVDPFHRYIVNFHADSSIVLPWH